jgi:cytoskeletal protein CcmA (bactofilin family)
MTEDEKKKKPEKDELADDSSLEEPTTQVAEDDSGALESDPEKAGSRQAAADSPLAAGEISFREKVIRRLGSINPYLVLFIIVILSGILIAFVANRINNQNDPSNLTFEGSDLDQEAVDELLSSEQNIGTVDQTLTVAANAIFNGKILIKDDLDVAGSIRVGGPLRLPGITVSGTSEFDDVNVTNNLSILGSASIQQSLTVNGGANFSENLSVGGTISASEISADSIEFSGDLSLTRHIDTGGGTPSASSGTAVGSGGTVSISGNDIAGTITINTGGGPPAGIFANISFVTGYNSTPNVQITPVNSSTGSLNYYVTRNAGGFSVGTASAPSSATTYVFDYFIVE